MEAIIQRQNSLAASTTCGQEIMFFGKTSKKDLMAAKAQKKYISMGYSIVGQVGLAPVSAEMQ